MSDKAPDNSSPAYTAAEFRQLGAEAAKAGLTIESLKRQVVRAYLAQPSPTPQVGRGWIGINLDSHKEKRFRAAADLAGMKFQLFCRFALAEYAENLEKKFSAYGKFPKRRIKVLAAIRSVVANIGGLFPAKN